MFRRPIAILLAALFLACGAPGALAQELLSVQPAAKDFRLGALAVSVLRDASLSIPNDGSVFGLGVDPASVTRVLSEASAPADKIRLDIDALLIRMPGHVVLIDTGYGKPGRSVLRESLALAGASSDEVTDILITHAHPDHVGGLVDAQKRSAFPKAKIRMSAKEWAFMQGEADARAIAAVIKAQVETFEPGAAVLPGVTALALSGHTPGHAGYEITSQGASLIDIGDTVHSSIISLAKPDWTIKWDSNKQEGARTRRQELQRLAATHALIFAPHFPFPGVGRIEQAGDGFRFRPELPSKP